MNDKFLAKQKKALLAEKTRLEKKIKSLEKYPDYGRGDDDNAREFEDFETNLGIEKELKILLKDVESALKAIENNKYGKCKICRNEIEEGRLLSMPYADICVNCKKKSKK